MNNTHEVLPYIDTQTILTVTHPKMNMMKVLQEHNRTFINWFKETIFDDDSASKTLRLLAFWPNLNVPTWKGYDINNYSFHTNSQNDKSSMQSSGVSLKADFEHFCSASNNNPTRAPMPYFGVIEEI